MTTTTTKTKRHDARQAQPAVNEAVRELVQRRVAEADAQRMMHEAYAQQVADAMVARIERECA